MNAFKNQAGKNIHKNQKKVESGLNGVRCAFVCRKII